MSASTDMVASPCVRVCVMEGDFCQGCGRSLEEISLWRQMSNQEKEAVWERLNSMQSDSSEPQ